MKVNKFFRKKQPRGSVRCSVCEKLFASASSFRDHYPCDEYSPNVVMV